MPRKNTLLLINCPTSERCGNERGTSVRDGKHKVLLSDPDEMQVPTKGSPQFEAELQCTFEGKATALCINTLLH